jgi:hypothetical protein
MPPPGNSEACGQSGPGKIEMFRARKNRLMGLLCRPAILPRPREFASSRNATGQLQPTVMTISILQPMADGVNGHGMARRYRD